MQENDLNDLTKPLIEVDSKSGAFEPDPNDPMIQRYVPTASERLRIEDWLKRELDQAYEDDAPNRQKKLDLLRAYKAEPQGKEQILVLPLVKRAVNQNVSWITSTIMGKKPVVTVTPDSNETITVLVDDPTFGPVPIEKTSEEVAQALEAYLQFKLLKRMSFRKIVKTAAREAKRGQTPTWIAVRHSPESRLTKAPRYEKSGPVAITFKSKDDVEIPSRDATRLENVSTYSMLMPADEQDPQDSRWLAESTPQRNEEFRRSLYNREYFLVDKSLWETLIEEGADEELTQADQQKSQQEKRTPGRPKEWHDVWCVWFFWTVPLKSTLISVDTESGEQQSKTITTYQEYSMVGYFHRKLGRLLSCIRNPFDHGMRPYVPVYDRKEPFRAAGESIAEDVAPYQKIVSQLNSLEIRGGIVATTPVAFVAPGSVAGEWIAENAIEPGSQIPRLKTDEIEVKNLGTHNQSLLGLIQFHNQEFEKTTSIGDLQLGLELPGRTPASTMAQALNAGETQAKEFLDDFREDLSDAIKLLIQTEQQYMRFGTVIPFDPETKATILAALDPKQEAPDLSGVPVRFPQEPIHHQFAFNITASSDDRSEQNDTEKLVTLKKILDADGQRLAMIIGPLMQMIQAVAAGQAPQALLDIIVADLKRGEKNVELLVKSMRKDGATFAIPQQLINALVQEQQQMAQMQQQMAAQNGAMNAQGTGPGGQPAGVPPNQSGLGGAVPEQGVPVQPQPDQGGAGAPAQSAPF